MHSLHNPESLADVIKAEAKLIRKKSMKCLGGKELQEVNKTIKYVIFLLMILDERVEKGLDRLEKSIERGEVNQKNNAG